MRFHIAFSTTQQPAGITGTALVLRHAGRRSRSQLFTPVLSHYHCEQRARRAGLVPIPPLTGIAESRVYAPRFRDVDSRIERPPSSARARRAKRCKKSQCRNIAGRKWSRLFHRAAIHISKSITRLSSIVSHQDNVDEVKMMMTRTCSFSFIYIVVASRQTTPGFPCRGRNTSRVAIWPQH